ncbi:amino acid adenylation domain-containing protein [Aquiflexum sp. LQ15W]|uniref:non-ribosomal peptide synthetase n=1 Tax=Cognataquiflexum nitidum TaxID=2922272 RepID=UPI001F13D766|nr:non-ribosomal peptide synthetase [Cognataquiflexum nitidum]MCH6198673.1 amino acid adenylation domain-containing protein [Cognataquiflexum nitidum]
MLLTKSPNTQSATNSSQLISDYWIKKLEGIEELQLPKDHSRSLTDRTEINTIDFLIDRSLLDNIVSHFSESKPSHPLVLLAALKVLLYRYSSQNDFCIGTNFKETVIENPNSEIVKTSFLDFLPIRSKIDGSQNFDEFVQKLEIDLAEANSYNQISVDQLITSLGIQNKRDLSILFTVILDYQKNTDLEDLNQSSKINLENFNSTLLFGFVENEEKIEGRITFDKEFYCSKTINRMVSHLVKLLESIHAQASQNIGLLNIIPIEEEFQLLKSFNDTFSPLPKGKTILDLFESQVVKTPYAIAVEFEGEQLSYKDLDIKSNHLAHYLTRNGLQPESLVPICIDRSLEMVIGIFGILKSGGAYVPIDPGLPKDRIDYMVQDTKADFVICSSKTEHNFGSEISLVVVDKEMESILRMPSEAILNSLLPDNLAYIIYTSGSTGKPKGVMIEHQNVANFLASMSKNVEFDANSSLLSVTTFSFDIFYLELFLPLINGGRVFLASREIAMDGFSLSKKLEEVRPTHMQATPSGWQMLLNSGWKNPQNIKMLVGGEALGEELKNTLVGIGTLWNMYGPTETTIWSTFKKMEIGQKVAIGKPIDNTAIYILSSDGILNPVGIPGELCIGGKGVGRGYLNRPELSSQKFLPDPFSNVSGGRMYRTGDLARWLHDGNIEYLGRMDDQVKIRGYRIELGEIESVLLLHHGVRQAVVIAKENGQGDKRLVGYVVCDGTFDKESVSAFLRSKLPEYMVPALWLQLEKLPLTFSGKIDRKALPEVGYADMGNVEYTKPRNDLEKQLAAIWQRILGLDRIGIHDDFFALGGHSLLAMRTVATVRKDLGAELSIRELFSAPTVEQLALILQSRSGQASSFAPQPMARPENIPLSYNQQSLWFIHKLEGSIQYHIPLILEIEGKLDILALEEALKTIVNRHEVLRTVITEKDGNYYQTVLGKDIWKLDRWDLPDPELLDNEISELIRTPFDLAHDHMMRACLITKTKGDYCLVITMHHISSDGWSANILKKELTECYQSIFNGIQGSLPPLPIQYIDYAIWQRNFLNSDAIQSKIDFWKAKLQNVAPLQLPTDFARPPIQSNNGNSYRFSIDDSVVSQLKELGQSHQTTLFMTLLAAFKTLLYRYSGQEDICVGTPVAGRESEETDDLIGFFVNTLALRSNLRGDMTFTELLKDIRTTTLESFEFQQIPFEMVVESLRQKRDLSRNPVFQVLFVLQNVPKNEVRLDDVLVSDETYENFTSKFDLTFELTEMEKGIAGIVEYNTDLYRPETMERFVSHFILLLKSIVENPSLNLDLINIIPTEERTLLLETLNATEAEYPHEKTIVDLFEQQVNKTPDAVALLFRDKELSYKELNERSNQFAHYLIERYNIQTDDLIGIELERSEWMVIGILAIIKSGGAYVPIDPEFPDQRKDFIKEDARLKLVINQAELEEFRKAINERNYPNTNPVTRISPENLMYVIYTSGSTGKPKGCMLEHRGLVNRLAWMQKSYALTEKDCILQKTTFTFDVSVWELIWWSLQGASVSMLEPGGEKQPEKIVSTIEAAQVTVLHFVPSMLEAFLEFLGSSTENILKLSSLKQVYTSGEALKAEQLKRFKELLPAVSLMNLYGPTEASIDVSYYACETAEELSIPIGKPIDNTALYVLNPTHHLVPYGTVGEICIGGVGLARGYLNREELTREKFIENPYRPEERLYRTGDLGRWRGDGNLEYLGRMDDQVKIRGYRIELGEIESVLVLHPNVKQAVVMARENGQGDKRLVGYVICDGTFDKESVSAFLRSKLPEYMVPALWVKLEKLPLTLSGKTDRKALPDVGIGDMVTAGYTEPRNEQEKQLAALWQRILGLDRIGIHDDFFALGGHSLLAMRAVASIRKELGSEISILDFFSAPTVAQLALILISRDNVLSNQVPMVVARPETIPLSYNQQSLWFIHQLEGSIQYHIPLIHNIRGKLDIRALEEVLKTIVNRHEVLRTVITEKDGNDCQTVLGKGLWRLDRMELPDPELLKNEITRLIRIPFDLAHDHMMRACLITKAQGDYCLVITMHHIASDGWSVNILRKELTECYQAITNGKPIPLSPLPLQYIDYAIWQRNFLNSDSIQPKIDFWKAKLQNVAPLQLPTDFARPPIQSNNGNSYRFSIDDSVVSQLKELGQSHQTTLFMTLLAAFKTLLYRYSGQEDICVGTPVAGRESEETDDLIGFFVNTLALRSNLRGDMTFTELLKDIRTTTLESFEFQQIPFEMVVESLRQKRDLSRNPVFQVLFVLQNVPKNEVRLDDVLVSDETYENFTSKFDLTFELTEMEKGIAGIVEYNTDLYRPETMERFVSHFILLLKSIVENPSLNLDLLNIIPTEERTLLLETLNATEAEYPQDKTIVDLFEEQVNKTPDATALLFRDDKLSYKELNERSNQFAHYLIEKHGVVNGDLVGIRLERSARMVLSVLGVLKTGAAYVPIDIDYPKERIAFIKQDSGCKLLIDEEEWDAFKLQDTLYSIDRPNVTIKLTDVIYVIYTSGSTGNPKGCVLNYGGVNNYLDWTSEYSRDISYSKVDLFSSLSFDFTITSLFGALTQGKALHVHNQFEDLSRQLKEIVLNPENGWIKLTPAHIKLIEEQTLREARSKVFVLGGEALTKELIEYLRKNEGSRIYNEYGPTEATVGCIVKEIGVDNEPYIGTPIQNTEIYLLDSSQHLVPYGVVGEICLGGVGIARGYLNRDDLTKEKFIENPYKPGKRLYRTGDLGKWGKDRNLEYLGRMDDQVKIRGNRIELGEIEQVLTSHLKVEQGVVLARLLKNTTDKELIAYSTGMATAEEMKAYLMEKLPQYMVPNFYVKLEKLPLTSNGKIDRKALPDLSIGDMVTPDYIEPRSELEKKLAVIWQRILSWERVGIHDDFFALGGNSLLSVKVISALEKEIGSKIPINLIFKFPNIFAFAKAIENSNQNQAGWNSLVAIKPSGSKPPLYIVHGVGSAVSIYYSLAKYIEDDQPIYGFQPKGLDGKEVPNSSLEEMASYYISLMIDQNPYGPYNISGYSFGGYVAYEMAQQLHAMGRKVGKLILFDTSSLDSYEKLSAFDKLKLRSKIILNEINFVLHEPQGYLEKKTRSYKRKRDKLLVKMKLKPDPKFLDDSRSVLNRVAKNNADILRSYKLVPYHGPMVLFRAKTQGFYVEEPKYYGWVPFVEKVNVVHVSGHHDNLFHKPEILKEMAEKIQKVLDEKPGS